MSEFESRPIASAEEAADHLIAGGQLTRDQLLSLSSLPTDRLARAAARVRDEYSATVITYSRKIFVPLTRLCRNVCHYCTFAKAPRAGAEPFMSVAAALEIVHAGKAAGCHEVLLTLGEKPEARYQVATDWLAANDFSSTVEYIAHVARAILDQTGLLPHINAGTLTADEMRLLRPVSASMGIMLETASERLCERGMPHYGSPDKHPSARLATLRNAGECRVPVTSGILIGIGESVAERIDALLALRELHAEHGQIQEVIIQNFRAKAGTRMASHPEPSSDDLVRAIALARLALGPAMSIQAPPNLSPLVLPGLIDAGINDWGGVSPVTPDHVNPEAPWPHLSELSSQTAKAGKTLVQRLTVYPEYIRNGALWIDPKVLSAVLRLSDADGMARESEWRAGGGTPPTAEDLRHLRPDLQAKPRISSEIRAIVERGIAGGDLTVAEVTRMFEVRADEFAYVCSAADELRRKATGDDVSYVVTRNINYTNVCAYKCRFCAFSKGKSHEDLRGKPYDITLDEVARRTREAWDRGATEVCMQGGIHPDYTGHTYLEICRAVIAAIPDMHVHAFSALEVTQGAATLGIPIGAYLKMLKESGLGSLPGTAAEVLDDEVRSVLCPDKLSTAEWLNVIETAHQVGLKTTSTIMFGHIDRPVHWARHLLAIRALQQRTGGFTEFVPLPFVAQEAPLYRKGLSRPGPTFREVLLMHAVSRIALYPAITNIQASWAKLGRDGVVACLNAGVNDLGGTLMNESISRAAGAVHGQEAPPEVLEQWIREAGRIPVQRNTFYGKADAPRRVASFQAPALLPIVNAPLRRRYPDANAGTAVMDPVSSGPRLLQV